MTLYKTFPPRWSHISVPLASRAAAKAAVALYAPCTTRGYAVQRAAWLLVTSIGPHALPGRASPLDIPVDDDSWDRLLQAWKEVVGGHDTIAVYQRPQRSRSGFAVLLIRSGRPIAFARLRRDNGAPFTKEHEVLRTLESADSSAFWHPRSIGVSTVGDWHSLLTTAMPPLPHRPVARLNVPALTAAIRAALLSDLAKPEGTPAHWEPMHGDFTPWNVRQARDNIAVIDWEDAGWGPPQADAVLYQAAEAALGKQQQLPGGAEAAHFWLHRLSLRRKDVAGDKFGRRLVEALNQIATDS